MRRTIWFVIGVLAAAVLAAASPLQAGVAPSELVFSSTFAGNRDIFTSSQDGSNRVDLTQDPHADITPSWSADGRRIAFASDRSGSFEIYVMNADGSNVVQMTHDSPATTRRSSTSPIAAGTGRSAESASTDPAKST